MGIEEFVQMHSRALLRTAWLLTGNWAAAEDLVQAALAKCWTRWSRIAAMEHPEAYVRRVLVTTYLGWRRRRWNAETVVEVLPDEPDAVDAYGAADLRDTLLAAMRQLPPRQRAVVALRYFQDLSEAETADALGCAVGTVKSQTSRAFTALRDIPGLRALSHPEVS